MQLQGDKQGSGGGQHTHLGQLQIKFGIGQCATGLVQLVFGIEQVQQGALANVELLLVGLFGFGGGQLVLAQQLELVAQAN